MSFATGAAVFNSCNKAGAVGYFTRHLEKCPGDWNALMWRAQAYNILGQTQNAARDIDRAIAVSSGVQRKLAQAEKGLSGGTMTDCMRTYKQITDEHPDCWRAWDKLGSLQRQSGDTESAVTSYRNAIDIAAENGEAKDPGVCWIHLQLGLIWSNRGELDIAIDYFKAAIESSPTHTISHINLCQSNLFKGNFTEARQSFSTALGLNPKLVKQVLGSDTFEGYFHQVQQEALAARSESSRQPVQQATSASNDPHWDMNSTQYDVYAGKSKSRQQARQSSSKTTVRSDQTPASGGSRGGRRGGGGDGGDSSGDDDDEHAGKDVNQIWKQLQKESPCIKMYKRHKYVQSKCGKYWYSKDTAGHAGVAFKRYDNTRNALVFRDSLDEKMRPAVGKHESREGTVIYKNEMVGVK